MKECINTTFFALTTLLYFCLIYYSKDNTNVYVYNFYKVAAVEAAAIAVVVVVWMVNGAMDRGKEVKEV